MIALQRIEADKIIGISDKDINKEYDLTKPVGDTGRAADCSHANEILGWKPKVTTEESRRKTYHISPPCSI